MSAPINGALEPRWAKGFAKFKPWKPGQSGNPAGWSRERRELHEAIEKTQVPKVMEMLNALFERGVDGDDIAAKLWLDHVRGPVKPRDDDAISAAVDARVIELVEEARRRKEEDGSPGGP